MKNNIKLVLLALGISMSCSLHAQKVTLKGRISNIEAEQSPLKLSRTNGYSQSIDLKADGSFNVTLDSLQPGLYRLDKVGELYLAPNYKLEVNVDKDGKTIFKGKGAIENQKLYQSRQAFSKFVPSSKSKLLFEAYMIDVPVFLGQLEKYRAEVTQPQKGIRDKNFTETLAKEADFAVATAIGSYRVYYGADSIRLANFYRYIDSADRRNPNLVAAIDSAFKASYLKSLTTIERNLVDSLSYAVINLNDEKSFDQSYAFKDLLDKWITNQVYKSGILEKEGFENMELAKIHIVNTLLPNEKIGGYYRYHFTSAYLKYVKDDAEAAKIYNTFMNNPGNAHYYGQMKTIYNNRIAVQKGRISPDFNFESIDGSQRKLSDLRGKYVYIDVWATWCGPCKVEIPHLITLEKELHDKNITFVSLSLDSPKDKQKWKDYVNEKELGGVQVISDNAFNTTFVEQYNINAIPRFILLDPEGRVISPNANRPSDPKLREELLGLLK